MPRVCIHCSQPIDHCMGFVLARDIVAQAEEPRELCGRCVFLAEVLIDLVTNMPRPKEQTSNGQKGK